MACMGSINVFTLIKLPNFAWKRIDYERYTVIHRLKSMMHQWQNPCIYLLFSLHISISLVVYSWKPNNTLPNYYLEQRVWLECVIRLHSIPSYTKHGEELYNSSKWYYVMMRGVLRWVGEWDGTYGYHKVFYLYKVSQLFMKSYRLRAIHGDAPFKVYDAPVPESLYILPILNKYKYIISCLYLETN